MGGDCKGLVLLFPWQCFNPRPRMGGDCPGARARRVPGVSIHAPAGGATYAALGGGVGEVVSIHAPAWGATLFSGHSKASFLFQSTPPHGGRRPCRWCVRSRWCFNPRPRMGGDSTGSTALPPVVFQSTPPYGGRLTLGQLKQ